MRSQQRVAISQFILLGAICLSFGARLHAADAPVRAPGILGVALGGPTLNDVVIDHVYWGYAAQKAGIQKGDRILEVDGAKVATHKEFIEAVIHKFAGETIALTLERSGKEQKIKITLGTEAISVGPIGAAWKKGAGSAPDQTEHTLSLKLPDSAAHAALRGVSFIDSLNGWIVGDKGLCLRTADGGTTWTQLDFGAQATLRTVRFDATGTGFISGDGEPNSPPPRGHVIFTSPMYSATLYRTLDGGTNWSAAWIPTNFQLYAVASAPKKFILGSFGGDAHSDGSTFVLEGDLKVKTLGRAFRGLFAMAIPAEGRAIAVGSAVAVGFFPQPTTPLYVNHGCRALFSADGGTTWQPSAGSEGAGSLRGLATLDATLAIAVGDKGQILRSDNAGESWKSVASPTTENLSAVAWDGNKTLLAVGKKGTLVASHDEGRTWQSVASDIHEDLRAVSAAGKLFVAVGGQGVALRIKLD